MADVFSQLYVQLVFSVKNRDALIQSNFEELLFKYITGIVSNRKQKLLIINGMPDHIHILLSLSPNCIISDLVKDIKVSSTKYINENKLCKFKFQWQNGYGAFSYGKSQVDSVFKYISNQKEHHKKYSFKDEYIKLLNKFEIEYKEEHLFEWVL